MRRSAARSAFTAVRTEGGILPAELLERLAAGDKDVAGLAPGDYHLGPQERLGEAVNRSWSRLVGAWASFRDALEKVPEGDPATRLTRERWLLPLFQELGYGRLLRSKALEVDGKSFALSHLWHRSPIHLMGAGLTLDRRTPGVAGAAAASPHGLVQELLNRSDDHLWGFVSNGLSLRLLRDHHSLTRQAYVELDLETIMDGELYSEFLLLWLICHQSRVEAEKPEECWLERWFQTSREEGVRALDKLRDGVKTAIEALGQGFLRHRANAELQSALERGDLAGQDYYRELLRLVYRLIFLFVAEDRDALLDPEAPDAAKDRYQRFYATRHLRNLADRSRGGAHGDLWQGLRLVMSKLGDGYPELALPALGSFLWRPEAIPHLAGCQLGNADLLAAVRVLCTIEDRGSRYPVNWRNVGSEELGSIYESLLELHPRFHREAGTFELATAAGHERKTTGSYYTPSSLVDCLLDSALDPVLEEAASQPDPEASILALTVCDPACGSGHFLVAAARRIAKRLAAVRSGDDEPSPEAVQHALRDVVGRCLYGVDINPMAVELCKVSLWMEAIEPGKPLSFLDHHIQVGNSLLGATPALLEKGIPDEAFKPIEGDDKKFCRELKKYNKQARETRQETLFDLHGRPWERIGDLATGLLDLDGISDDTADGVRRKEERWREILESEGYETSRMWADAWCAAFVWEKVDDPEKPYPITEQVFRKMERNPQFVDVRVRAEVRRLAEEYGFFHWHLAFPGVLRSDVGDEDLEESHPGWSGGFDVVLGNPPWDRIKLQEKEFFTSLRPDIAGSRNAATRRRKIAALKEEDGRLFENFLRARRRADGTSSLIRNNGRYPLCGHGDLNTYPCFAEVALHLLNSTGCLGCILPPGIVADKTTSRFFNFLMKSQRIASYFGFINERKMFAGVLHNFKFGLLTAGGARRRWPRPHFAFNLYSTNELFEQARIFSLTASDIEALNPESFTCPVFFWKRSADITKDLYSRLPVLGDRTSGWSVDLYTMFHMANDSSLFALEAAGENTRLFEAKMINQFDHRFGSYAHLAPGERSHMLPPTPEEEHSHSDYIVQPCYYVPKLEVGRRLKGKWPDTWLLGYREVTSAGLLRTAIASAIPAEGVNHKIPLFTLGSRLASEALFILGCFNSFVFDFLVRQKLSGASLSFYIVRQIPVVVASRGSESLLVNPEDFDQWLLPRTLELVYTAWDLQPFAQDCGYDGPPFRWDEARRFLLRCELDAAFFHLYGIERDDVDYIMETFPIVKRKDVKKHGDFRTKLQILDIYDSMQRAVDTGEPYQTLLDPPPADPRVAHPPRKPEPEDAATVVTFPSPPPEPATYQHEPDLSEVAEPAPPYDPPETADTTPSQRIADWLREHPGWHARADILDALGDVTAGQWNTAIRELVEFGEVEKKGKKRGTRYRAAAEAGS